MIEIEFKVGAWVSRRIVCVQGVLQLPAASWDWTDTVLLPEAKLIVVEKLPWELADSGWRMADCWINTLLSGSVVPEIV